MARVPIAVRLTAANCYNPFTLLYYQDTVTFIKKLQMRNCCYTRN